MGPGGSDVGLLIIIYAWKKLYTYLARSCSGFVRASPPAAAVVVLLARHFVYIYIGIYPRVVVVVSSRPVAARGQDTEGQREGVICYIYRTFLLALCSLSLSLAEPACDAPPLSLSRGITTTTIYCPNRAYTHIQHTMYYVLAQQR